MKILLIHGPNLNLLGKRETDVYGEESFEELNQKIGEHAGKLGAEIDIFQSNHEGEIVDKIQASGNYDCIIINPGAFTHYSLAIRDALAGVTTPAIEVHLSNIYSRESFRANSVVSEVVIGQISGFGHLSYLLAIDAALSSVQAAQ